MGQLFLLSPLRAVACVVHFIIFSFFFFFSLAISCDQTDTLGAPDAFWPRRNPRLVAGFRRRSLATVLFLSLLSVLLVRKHYPDSCFCCCFSPTESSSLKAVLGRQKNKFDFWPGGERHRPLKSCPGQRNATVSPTQSSCLLQQCPL